MVDGMSRTPGRQADLEKVREKALLKEFEEYKRGHGRLQGCFAPGLRGRVQGMLGGGLQDHSGSGKALCQDSVLQEDSALLMYHDNALIMAWGTIADLVRVLVLALARRYQPGDWKQVLSMANRSKSSKRWTCGERLSTGPGPGLEKVVRSFRKKILLPSRRLMFLVEKDSCTRWLQPASRRAWPIRTSLSPRSRARVVPLPHQIYAGVSNTLR